MSALLQVLSDLGSTLLIGSTALLSVGAALIWLQREPIHRQRTAEITVLCVLAWFVLTLVPLPRLKLSHLAPTPLGPVPVSTSREGEAPAEPPTSARIEVPALKVSEPFIDVLEDSMLASSSSERTSLHTLQSPLDKDQLESVSESELSADDESAKLLPSLESSDIRGSAGASPSPDSNSSLEIPANWSDSNVISFAASVARKTSAANVAENPVEIPSTDWPAVFSGLYLAGTAFCAIFLLAGYVLLSRLCRQTSETPSWLDRDFRQECEGLRKISLRVSASCRRMFSAGIVRPIIVVPASWIDLQRRQQLLQALRHELVHVRRRDGSSRLIFNLALPVLYVHPLYWWIRREANLASELIADDWAAAHSSPETYAADLVELVRSHHGRAPLSLGAIPLFRSRSHFFRRLDMLIRRTTPLATNTSKRWLLTILAAMLLPTALCLSLSGREAAAVEPVTTEPSPTEKAAEPTSAAQSTPQVSVPEKQPSVATEATGKPDQPGQRGASTAVAQEDFQWPEPSLKGLWYDVMAYRNSLRQLETVRAKLTRELGLLALKNERDEIKLQQLKTAVAKIQETVETGRGRFALYWGKQAVNAVFDNSNSLDWVFPRTCIERQPRMGDSPGPDRLDIWEVITTYRQHVAPLIGQEIMLTEELGKCLLADQIDESKINALKDERRRVLEKKEMFDSSFQHDWGLRGLAVANISSFDRMKLFLTAHPINLEQSPKNAFLLKLSDARQVDLPPSNHQFEQALGITDADRPGLPDFLKSPSPSTMGAGLNLPRLRVPDEPQHVASPATAPSTVQSTAPASTVPSTQSAPVASAQPTRLSYDENSSSTPVASPSTSSAVPGSTAPSPAGTPRPATPSNTVPAFVVPANEAFPADSFRPRTATIAAPALPPELQTAATKDGEMDLLKLATAFTDAIEAYEIAKSDFARAQAFADGATGSKADVEKASIVVAIAKNRLDLLSEIASATAKAALLEQEHAREHLKRTRARGNPKDAQAISEAEQRVLRAEYRAHLHELIRASKGKFEPQPQPSEQQDRPYEKQPQSSEVERKS